MTPHPRTRWRERGECTEHVLPGRGHFGTGRSSPSVSQALPKWVIGTGFVAGVAPRWARQVIGDLRGGAGTCPGAGGRVILIPTRDRVNHFRRPVGAGA